MDENEKPKAITPEEMEKVYKQRRDYERNREWKWRHTMQGEFESSFVSLDAMVDESDDPSKLPFQHSQTLGGVITGISDMPSNLSDCHKLKLDYACQKLKRAGKGYLVRVLRLIAKYGKNRKESIWQLMLDMARQKTNTTNTVRSWRHSSESPCGRKRRKHRKIRNPKKGLKKVSKSGQPKKN